MMMLSVASYPVGLQLTNDTEISIGAKARTNERHDGETSERGEGIDEIQQI